VLTATLFLAGAMDAITDVAQNSHGLRVQKLYRRSILNSFHAVWSIGAVLGGLMGATAAGLDVPRGLHLGVSFVLFSALTLACYRFLLPGPEPVEPDDESPATAASGVSGRTPLVTAVAQAGGALAAVGMGTALLFPSIPLTILGFGLAGLGVATLVPAAMHSADELPGLRTGTGLTVISWLLRLGFLLSPPIVGAVADASSLRVGLIVVPLAGILTLLASPVLPKRVHRHH
jgi:hypothetical protein